MNEIINHRVAMSDLGKCINESVENDNKFDWYLEYKNRDEIVLYADEREDEITTDRYPKHKEIEGKAALSRVRKLLKDGYQGGIGVDKGKGSRAVHGFLRLGEDGKTLMIEIESKGSRNGKLVDLCESKNTVEDFAVGDKVKMIPAYEQIGMKYGDHAEVIGFSRDGKLVKVKYENKNIVHYYDPSCLEKL